MTKYLFYKYDFFAIEMRYAENEIIDILNKEKSLNNIIELFMQNICDSLFMSIKENKNIEISTIALPQIENDLKKALDGNCHYDAYVEANSKNSLSEVVFNKFLSKVFRKDGLNSNKYIIQDCLHAWLEKKLALQIVKNTNFNPVHMLIELIKKTKMLHQYFYIHLVNNIPIEWIESNKEDWTKVDINPKNIINCVRTFEKEYFSNYNDFLNSIDKTNLWNFICEATRGSDYAFLSEELAFRSSVLIEKIENDMLLWIEFWDNLKFPIIQDGTLYLYFNSKPKQYLKLINVLVSKKIELKSDIKVLLLIIAKNYFETSYKLTERLSIYEEKDRINENNKHFFEEGQRYYSEWLEEKPNYYKEFIENLIGNLPNPDIEDWIFSYKPRINNWHYKQNEIYNSEIKLLTDTYKSCRTSSINFDMQEFNFQKFNFYVQIIKDSKNENLSFNLLDTMLNYISSDKFYWDNSYSEPYLSSIKGIGYLISLDHNPIQKAKEIISRFKINHQGWKPVMIDYKPITKESFVYSGIALLFEYHTAFKDISLKIDFFEEFLKIILMQDRYSQIDNSEYYQRPLHLLFLICNQLFTDVKEYFEHELIENYDNFYFLLCILYSDEETICSQSKFLLGDRLKKEFLIEKRKFNNKSQIERVQKMEKMIEILLKPCEN